MVWKTRQERYKVGNVRLAILVEGNPNIYIYIYIYMYVCVCVYV